MSEHRDRLKVAVADRYTIIQPIGRGGMATVYLAQDLKHQRQVAIKVLRPELAAALGVDRFLREIEIGSALTHPHILPLYDSGEADGYLYYVMPYIDGESLRGRLDRETQLTLRDALHIAREVADGLSYAHRHGVVHRDIKPENILLSGGHAIIADFGIARAIKAAVEDRITEPGFPVGTPTYMSPEQAAGEQTLDGRTDIYALGCVLYDDSRRPRCGHHQGFGQDAGRSVPQHGAVWGGSRFPERVHGSPRGGHAAGCRNRRTLVRLRGSDPRATDGVTASACDP